MEMIKINIVENDVSTVAKVVLIDQKKRVLLLKRSRYTKKYAGDWDLPGGHLKRDENLISGLKREVKEETMLDIREPVFLLKMDNLNFFHAMYDSQEVKLSHEHTDFRFFNKSELDLSQKFQKIALKALEKIENESFHN